MKLKRLAGCSAAVVLALSSAMNVSAATLKDLFDADYYASKNPDVKEAYGDDDEALWNHYIACGIAEGRDMNELLNVTKYRAAYADLEEAFGDDWDAYVNHFLIAGAKEGRDSATSFNALDYAASENLQEEVYGEDILALYKHYKTGGNPITAETKAEESATSRTYTKRYEHSSGGGWTIVEYNDAGKSVKATYYNANGSVTYWITYEYDGAGNMTKQAVYDPDGTREETIYNNGKEAWIIRYRPNSNIRYLEIRCDDTGKPIETIYYDENDNIYGRAVNVFNSAGVHVGTRNYDGDGNLEGWSEYVFNAANNTTIDTHYDANGKKLWTKVYPH